MAGCLGGVHAVPENRLDAHRHAQTLGFRQDFFKAFAQQVLRALTAGAGRLQHHARCLGADAPGAQRPADGQLALEIGQVAAALGLVVNRQLHIGAQHPDPDMVPPAGFDGIGHQFGGDVGVFFHAGHAFLVGQLHGAQAVGSHFGKKLVGGAAAVIMQPAPRINSAIVIVLSRFLKQGAARPPGCWLRGRRQPRLYTGRRRRPCTVQRPQKAGCTGASQQKCGMDLLFDKKCAIVNEMTNKALCTAGWKGGRTMREYTYAPQVDFFIEYASHDSSYEMSSFHTHHKYELYYEVEGTRRYFIEDAAYIVNAGSVILIGDNQLHKTGAVGEGPSSRIVCNFSASYLKEITTAFPEIDFLGFLHKEENHLLSNTTVKQQNYVYSVLQQLIAVQGDSTESHATRKMLLAGLLLQLKKMCEAQRELGGDTGRVTNRIVGQIQSYIAEHYAEKLTLTGIAKQFYISPYYLSRLFKKTINLSLIEYINGVRVKAAQSLIEKTNDSISTVAEKAGFMTSAHFRRVFKEATGLSPQQYRQYYKRFHKEG